jgi:hypothetical protein
MASQWLSPTRNKSIVAKGTILPLAGMDTANIHTCCEALTLKTQLSYKRNEVERDVLNGKMKNLEE